MLENPMAFDREKFKTLVLYVIWRSASAREFGLTKLNKVLWFSDARSFEENGTSISGESYTRQKFGPVACHLNEVLQELCGSKLVQHWVEPYFDFEVQRYSAHAPPDMSAFTGQELGFIDWWIRRISEAPASTSTQSTSHDYGWQIAKLGEALPLHAVLSRRIRPPREGEELDWALRSARLQETT